MVARARGHAGVGKPPFGGDRRDDGLRAVAPGHGQPVGAALDGLAHQRLEVEAELQLDRLDAAGARLVGQRKTRGLPPTRAGVVDQHRAPWARRRRQRHMTGERDLGRAQRDAEPDDDEDDVEDAVVDHHQHERDDQQHHRGAEAEGAREAAAPQPVPRRPEPEDDATDHCQSAWQSIDRHEDGQRDRERPDDEGDKRREPSSRHRIGPR